MLAIWGQRGLPDPRLLLRRGLPAPIVWRHGLVRRPKMGPWLDLITDTHYRLVYRHVVFTSYFPLVAKS